MLVSFAHMGWNAIGVDINEDYVEKINHGISPIEEPLVQEYLTENADRISATVDADYAVKSSSVSFVVVPTPSMNNGKFFIQFVQKALEEIAKALRSKEDYHLIVITSTILPGDMARLARTVEEVSEKRLNIDYGLCYNPDFIALGKVVHDFLHPDMVLIGQSDRKAGDILEGIHRGIAENTPPIYKMSWENAELAKISLNSYCTMKITFANVIGEICENMPGGDADAVLRAIGSDTRIGHRYLKPGLAWAGPCVKPETLIQTNKGLKRIDQLKIGDLVLTHKGRYREITEIYTRPYDGPMIKIISMGYSSVPIITTPDHPIWSASRKSVGKKYRTVSTTGKHRLGMTKGFNVPQFISAYKIEHADSILMPVFNPELIPIPVLSFKTHYISNLPARLELTPELLEFFGFYISEGSSWKKEVKISLHEKETVFADRVVQIVYKYFGAKAQIKPHGKKGIKVRFCATHLVPYLKEIFGGRANEKRAPWEWLCLPEEYLIGLLRGIWYGDGSRSGGVYTYGTVSLELCRFVYFSLFRFGIASCIQEAEEKTGKDGVHHQKAYFIRVGNGIFYNKMNELFPDLQIKRVPKGSNLTWCDGSAIGFNVKSVSEEQYRGHVYNLEVEEDNSYVLEWGTVHNCFPRDNSAFSKVARDYGVVNTLSETNDAINHYHRSVRILNYVKKYIRRSDATKIAVLGLSYKEDTPVIEESVSIRAIKGLIGQGVEVIVYDPLAMENARKELPEGVIFADSMLSCIRGQVICFVATPHSEFKTLSPDDIRFNMGKDPVILDAWNIFPNSMEGISVKKIGKNYAQS